MILRHTVTERLRQQKRRSEEDYEHATTRRQPDRQRTSQARSAEGDEQATAHRDENHKFAQVQSVDADEHAKRRRDENCQRI